MLRRTALIAVTVLLVVHGLICLTGVNRALGWLWVSSGLLALAAAVLLVVDRRHWWIVGALAVTLSQVAIVTAWGEAWAGTIVNALLALAVLYGWRSQGRSSARARYRRAVAALPGTAATVRTPEDDVLIEADLGSLPAPVAQYVRRTGSVGLPRVTGFRARIRGRIRGGPDQPWMPFTGEQANTFTPVVSRYFLLDATMKGLPVDVLHVLADGHASMRALLLSTIPVVDASGPELDRAEAVTVFNDLCVFAPAALADAPVQWEPVDDRHARGRFSWAGHTVGATLVFDDEGDLVDFVSDDRLASDPDGRSFTAMRWSTPLRDYREFHGRRIATHGEGRWHPESGEYAYLEMTIEDVSMLGGGHDVRGDDRSPRTGSTPRYPAAA